MVTEVVGCLRGWSSRDCQSGRSSSRARGSMTAPERIWEPWKGVSGEGDSGKGILTYFRALLENDDADVALGVLCAELECKVGGAVARAVVDNENLV